MIDAMTDDARMLQALKIAVRAAWRVLALCPDPDARFQGMHTGWVLPVVHEAKEAYGYSEARATPIRPSPQDITRMEAVMTWMVWLRQAEGEWAVRRIMGWSMDTQWHILAGREGCSERTVQNRIDLSMAAIMKRFLDIKVKVEVIEERPLSAKRIRGFAPPIQYAEPAGDVEAGKVYIGGVGLMFRGKPYNPGENLIGKKQGYR